RRERRRWTTLLLGLLPSHPGSPSSTPYTVWAPRVRERKREPTSWDMGTIECKRSRDAPIAEGVGACRPEDRSTPSLRRLSGRVSRSARERRRGSRESCPQEGRYKANLAVHTLAVQCTVRPDERS